jgi:hypothetical protein
MVSREGKNRMHDVGLAEGNVHDDVHHTALHHGVDRAVGYEMVCQTMLALCFPIGLSGVTREHGWCARSVTTLRHHHALAEDREGDRAKSTYVEAPCGPCQPVNATPPLR